VSRVASDAEPEFGRAGYALAFDHFLTVRGLLPASAADLAPARPGQRIFLQRSAIRARPVDCKSIKYCQNISSPSPILVTQVSYFSQNQIEISLIAHNNNILYY
jgi:hypothetical protein